MSETGYVEHHQGGNDWRKVAAAAGFVFYRPSWPQPDSTWAGGCGFNGDVPSRVGVSATVDGAEVSVDTTPIGRRHHPGLEQRGRIAEAIWHHLLADLAPVELPATVRIEPEDHVVDVGGESTIFTGFRVAGSPRWSGSATMDTVVVAITTTDPATVSAIEPADTADVADHPPGLSDC